MLKIFRWAKFVIGFCGTLYFFYQPVYAQRAGTTTERNDDAKVINDLYKAGKWEEGKKKAEEALKSNPKDSDMRMLLGKYYLKRKSYDKARYELVKSLEYAPANVDAKHMLVTVETETERFSSAICYINELLEVNPYWKGLWRQKIELYRTMGNHVEADRLLKRISQIYPEDNDLKKDQSYVIEQKELALRKSGRLDEAIELGKKTVEDKPREQSSYLTVIDNYIKAGDYSNALVYTERALNEFPGNASFVQKKISILEHQRRYSEILGFMEAEMKARGGNFRYLYNYYLLEAARSAKNNEAATLYGKVLDSSPSNIEAFNYVFNDLIAKSQFEQALTVLSKHKGSVINSKDLDMKELMLFRRMGNNGKVATLTREYFIKYPGDTELKESYVNLLLTQAKDNVQNGRLSQAINDWKEVIQHGNDDAIGIAQQGIYNAYVNSSRYQDAIVVLDDMLLDEPGNPELILKKADLYNKEGRYEYALNLYEQVLGSASPQERSYLIHGYNDIIQPQVKVLKDSYRLNEARKLTDRWLTIDQRNIDALLNMINICYQLKDKDAMLRYAQIAGDMYGDDVEFKIKLAEAMNHSPEKQADSWALLHNQTKLNPYHEPLVNTFSSITEDYAAQLLKAKDYETALEVVDTALNFREDYKPLKYLKGLAYEGLKQYDSAYYYQKFYEPSLLELDDFKNHLNYLSQKSFRNNITISHLRARFGDEYSISSVSSVDYSRLLTNGGSYVGRIHYAGRDNGKGIQGQFEWSNPWTDKLSTRFDIAFSNKFFSKIAANASAQYVFMPTWEVEAGLGYRRFFEEENFFNFNVGLSKEFADFKLSTKLNNFLLDSEGIRTYLYSLGFKGQYQMNNPRNYLLALASVGNSPDIEIINYQFYNSFNVFNAMVGAGIGHLITKNIGANIVGTWYNYQSDNPNGENLLYRNFYNFYFQFNVSF